MRDRHFVLGFAATLIALIRIIGAPSIVRANEGKIPTAEQQERLKQRDAENREHAKHLREGDFSASIEALENALTIEQEVLGDESYDVFSTHYWLAKLCALDGDFDAANKWANASLASHEKNFAKDHWRVLNVRRSVAYIQQVQAMSNEKRTRLRKAEQLRAQVEHLGSESRFQEAMPKATEAVAICKEVLGENSVDYLLNYGNLGWLYRETNDQAKAEPILRSVLEGRERLLGDEHVDYALSHNALAWSYVAQNDFANAEKFFRRAADLYRRAQGPLGPEYAVSINNLAELFVRKRDYRRAAALRREVVEIRRQTVGRQHTDYALALKDLAVVLNYLREFQEAEPLLVESLQIYKSQVGEKDSGYISCLLNLSYSYQQMGDHDKALKLELQGLEAEKEKWGPDHENIGIRLHHVGSIYFDQKDYVRALEYERMALEIFEKHQNENRGHYEASLGNVAFFDDIVANDARKKEDFGLARKALGESIECYVKLFGDEHWRVTNTRLLSAYYDQLEKLTADQRREIAEVEELETEIYELERSGEYSKALPLQTKVLEVRTRLLGENHFKTIHARGGLGYLYKEAGQYHKAEPIYVTQPDLARAVFGELHPEYHSSLHNLGALYEAWGDFRRAAPALETALEIAKKVYGEKSDRAANTMNSLANTSIELGQLSKAESLYREALDIRRQVLQPNDANLGHSLLNLGAFYMWQVNDNTKAEPFLQQALEVYRAGLGEQHPDYARGIDYLASLYSRKEQYAQAKELYEKALAIRSATLGATHPECAVTLHNLGVLHSSQFLPEEAEVYFLEALKLDNRGKDSPGQALTLQNLTEAYLDSGKFDKAETLAEEVSRIYEKALGEHSLRYAESLSLLARVHTRKGDPARGLPLALKGLVVARDHMARNASFMSERQLLAVRLELWGFLNTYLKTAAKAGRSAQEMYAQALSWKGEVGARQRQMRQIQAELAKSGNTAAIRVKAELDEATRSLAMLSRATAPDPERPYRIDELSDKIERLQSKLAAASAEYRKQQEDRMRTPDDIVQTLPRDAVLVDFLSLDEERPLAEQRESGKKWTSILNAFILRPGRPVERVVLGPKEPIETAIANWRKHFGRATSQGDPRAELRRIVWQPLEPHVVGAKLLLISPNSLTAPIPWAALPGSEKGSYLIDEYAIGTVAVPRSLPDLLEAETSSDDLHGEGDSRAKSNASLLIVGDVDFDLRSEGAAQTAPVDYLAVRGGAPLHWSALPGTRDEIEAIQMSFRKSFDASQAKALTRASATTSTLRNELGKYQYVHLSTHGFFAPPQVAAAGSDASEGKLNRTMSTNVTGVHPGLLSGLVLAGANHPGDGASDDGIITALEVAELDLSHVQLATLSACETGLGQSAGGEGLLGLQRAFQTAGAKTVVASLWKVPDRATQLLMTRFYNNLWERRMSKLEALRDAQRWLMREGPRQPGIFRGVDLDETFDAAADDGDDLSPYYWAAFVLSGDWQ